MFPALNQFEVGLNMLYFLDSTCCISSHHFVQFVSVSVLYFHRPRIGVVQDPLDDFVAIYHWDLNCVCLFVCLFVSQGGTSVNCYLSLASLIGQLYLWPKSNQSNFPRLSFYGVTLLYFMASHVSDLHWEQECTPVFLLKISPFYSGHSSESRILYFQISIPALSQARPGCLFIQKPGGRD